MHVMQPHATTWSLKHGVVRHETRGKKLPRVPTNLSTSASTILSSLPSTSTLNTTLDMASTESKPLERFQDPKADIVLSSADGVTCRVHSYVLRANR